MKKREPQWLTRTMKQEIESALRCYAELFKRFRDLDEHLNAQAMSGSGISERVDSSPTGLSPQERAVDLKEKHGEFCKLQAVLHGIVRGLESLTARQREFVQVVYEDNDRLPISEAVEILGFDGVVREKKYYELRDRVLCRLAPHILEPYRQYAYSQCFSKFGWKKMGDFITDKFKVE
jgi:hypothetical protein